MELCRSQVAETAHQCRYSSDFERVQELANRGLLLSVITGVLTGRLQLMVYRSDSCVSVFLLLFISIFRLYFFTVFLSLLIRGVISPLITSTAL